LKEILKSKCLPVELENKSNVPDFNGIGGAVMLFNENIYLTIGAPESGSQNIRELAQSDVSIFGKILKISTKDLLKSDQENLKYSIYSSGHRNPQGIVEINNKIFSIEHGPQGGDELNLIFDGKNYGWPLKSYGTRYMDGKPFKYSEKIENYQEPIYSFLPAIGPSSLSKCPKNLEDYYSENICLMLLTLKERSVFIILLDDDNLMIQSMEQIKLKKRLRHFAVDKNIKTFFDENSFYVSTDSGKDLNILKLSFLNFR
jgi:glucose/arabinose dehydrogenase